MKLYYKLKNIFFNKTFILFVLIGIVNTLIYNEYYLIGIKFTNYIISSVLAYLISMTCSFFMNTVYNFKIKPTIKKYLLFPISSIPTFICQTFGLSLLVEVFNIPKTYSGFIASLVAIPFSFIIMKYIIKK